MEPPRSCCPMWATGAEPGQPPPVLLCGGQRPPGKAACILGVEARTRWKRLRQSLTAVHKTLGRRLVRTLRTAGEGVLRWNSFSSNKTP